MDILVCVKRVPLTGGKMVLTADERAIETRHLGFTISPHEECGVEEAVRIVEAGGGLLIIVGWQTRPVALLLAIFCAVAAYFFHDFWNQPPGPQHVNNMIHFMKNVSIIGGFLMLCAVGAGRYSFDGPCIRPEYLRT